MIYNILSVLGVHPSDLSGCMLSFFSHVWLLVTPWTNLPGSSACWILLQRYWSGLPSLPPGAKWFSYLVKILTATSWGRNCFPHLSDEVGSNYLHFITEELNNAPQVHEVKFPTSLWSPLAVYTSKLSILFLISNYLVLEMFFLDLLSWYYDHFGLISFL